MAVGTFASVLVLVILVCVCFWVQEPNAITSKDLPTLNFDQAKPKESIQQIVNAAHPVLIKSSPSDKWEAMKTWSPDYLKEEFKKYNESALLNCKRSISPLFILRNQEKPIQTVLPHEVKYETTNLTIDEFFNPQHNSSNIVYQYYSGKLSWWHQELQNDITRINTFYINEMESQYWLPETMVWMGNGNITANCHYDRSHNFFFQVFGRKKWTLYPPTDWNSLYLFPFLDGAYHQSQISNVANPQNDNLSHQYPLFPQRSQPFEVILEPGDVMYIPPFWFHQVESLGFAISVSIVSPSRTEEKIGAAIWEIEHLLPSQTRIDLLIHSVYHLVHEVYQRAAHFSTDRFVQSNLSVAQRINILLFSRYRDVKENAELSDISCDALITQLEPNDNIGEPTQQVVESRIAIIAEDIAKLPDGLREISLANGLEVLLSTMMPADHVKPFVRCIVF